MQCNHYECLATPTEDIWLVHVNGTDGLDTWEESVGTSADEGAYSIKRLPDGSYVMAGYTTQNGERDFYIVKFQLTDACPAPTGLSVTTAGYCATFSWTMDPCIPRYKLEYKKAGGSWIEIDNATSPKSINTLNECPGTSYEWRVTAFCSPSNSSTTSSTFSVPCCNGAVAGCNICNHAGGKIAEGNSTSMSVYPNPSEGSVRINLQLQNAINGVTLIEIRDQAGKFVFLSECKIENGLVDQHFSLDNIPAGFYWVEVLVDGNRYQSKLIVQTE